MIGDGKKVYEVKFVNMHTCRLDLARPQDMMKRKTKKHSGWR